MKLKNIIISSSVLFGVLITSAKVQAHYVKSKLNHGHICTLFTSLNVREGPSLSYKKVGSVNKGKRVGIKGSYSNWSNNEVWYDINTDNTSGYVSGEYVCF